MKVEISGSTVYELNDHGFNRWSVHVEPGRDNADERITDQECKNIAKMIHAALSASTPAQEPAGVDAGPWIVYYSNASVGIASKDSHDVFLRIEGDFPSKAEKLAYADGLAATLNAARATPTAPVAYDPEGVDAPPAVSASCERWLNGYFPLRPTTFTRMNMLAAYEAGWELLANAALPPAEAREPLSEAEIETLIDKANRAFNGRRLGVSGQQMTTYDDWKYWLAKFVQRACAAKWGIPLAGNTEGQGDEQ